jgi:hypothetical protein
VKILVFLSFTIEEKEGINKQGKVIYQRDIKGAILLQICGGNPENVREVD